MSHGGMADNFFDDDADDVMIGWPCVCRGG